MLFESTHRAYMNKSVGDLMTNYPHIFIKSLLISLQKAGFKEASNSLIQHYYNSFKEEFDKNRPEDIFTYNQKEISLDDDKEFSFQLKGTNLIFSIGANRTAQFKVSAAMNSQEFINYFVKKVSIVFLDNSEKWKTWRDKVYDDPENMYNKEDTRTEAMDTFAEMMQNHFKIYEIKCISNSKDYNLTFLVRPEELYTPNINLGVGKKFFMKCQANDLKKIYMSFNRFMKNNYKSEILSIECDIDKIEFNYENPFRNVGKRESVPEEKFFNLLKRMTEGETGTRKDYYKLILDNLFLKN